MGLFGIGKNKEKDREREERARFDQARQRMEEALERRDRQQGAPPAGQSTAAGSVTPRPAGTQPSAGAPRSASPSPASGPASDAAASTYTVRSGDTLSAIAQRTYGRASEWRRIFEANRETIDDPDRIYPGQVLRLPAPGKDKPVA